MITADTSQLAGPAVRSSEATTAASADNSYVIDGSSFDAAEMAKWNVLAEKWSDFRPPIRPDKTDLNRVGREVTAKDRRAHSSRTLILGSTPEFRDLTARLRLPVTVADQNPRMIELMQKLRRHPGGHERRHIGDWFEYLPKKQGSFDLILSDLTQGNVRYEDRAWFYNMITHALVPGGIFIDRIFRFGDEDRLPSLAEVAQDFDSDADVSLEALNQSLFRLIASEEVRRAGIAELGSVYRQLLSYGSSRIQTKISAIDEYLAPNSVIWHCGRSWSNLVADYPRNLSLVREYRRTEEHLLDVPRLQVWQRTDY